MLYTPTYFAEKNEQKIRSLIEQNPFATVIAPQDDGKTPLLSHLPLIFSKTQGDENVLIGHMARGNPLWRQFQKRGNCMLVFHGPHTYISSRWYEENDVPTWNYAAVHLHGKIELIEDYQGQIDILKQMRDLFEGTDADAWQFVLPQDLSSERAVTKAIISFRFYTEKTEAKFKMSQNRNLKDRTNVMEGLAKRCDEQSQRVRELMLENEKSR